MWGVGGQSVEKSQQAQRVAWGGETPFVSEGSPPGCGNMPPLGVLRRDKVDRRHVMEVSVTREGSFGNHLDSDEAARLSATFCPWPSC